MWWRRFFVATTSPRAHRTGFMCALEGCRSRHAGQYRAEDKELVSLGGLRFAAETLHRSAQSV